MYEITIRLVSTTPFPSMDELRSDNFRVSSDRVDNFWNVNWCTQNSFDFLALNSGAVMENLDTIFSECFHSAGSLATDFYTNVGHYTDTYLNEYVPKVITFLATLENDIQQTDPARGKNLNVASRFRFYVEMSLETEKYPPLPLMSPLACEGMYFILDKSRVVIHEVCPCTVL
jgi:hypothetical protein